MSEGNGEVVGSPEALRNTQAAKNPVRFIEVPVENFGTARFRSMTAGEFIVMQDVSAAKDEDHILCVSMVNSDGHRWVDSEALDFMRSDKFDGKVFTTLIAIANEHCLKLTAEDLIEAAAKN